MNCMKLFFCKSDPENYKICYNTFLLWQVATLLIDFILFQLHTFIITFKEYINSSPVADSS
jgi:hypothetical protein